MKIIHKQEIKQREKLTTKEMLNKLLENRAVTDLESFISPPSPLSLHLKDFDYGKEFEKIIGLLKKIREEGKTVVVYTDYDADGVTGGAILWETLFLLGFKVMPYVPHRRLEGYGFSIKGIDTVIEQYNPALIISVDHGIAAPDQIAYAQSKGVPVIVTDHHHKQERIPQAEAIFHIPALSGSGVAYYFAKEVYEHLGTNNPNQKLLEHNFSADYLSLASIGTIADLVPLVGPSRALVKQGLLAFPLVKRYGIRHICKEAGIEGKMITPYEVGFLIAPRINAVGRLEHAIDALRLLCTTNEARAAGLAGKVGVTNTARQDLVKKSVEEAMEQVESLRVNGELPKLIILHSKDWHEGIIGLIASKVVEKYYRPAIVMAEPDGQLKGSARSIPSFHITEFFGSIKDLMLNYGGHKAAGGFTIEKSRLDEFKKTAVEKASVLIKDIDLEKIIEVDLKMPVEHISLSLARDLEILNPFGVGNPQPSFVSTVELMNAQLFGKNNDHLKMFIKDVNSPNSFPLEIIAFGKADLFNNLSRDQKLDVAYQLDINRWNGRETLRGRLLEFTPVGKVDVL